MVFNFIYGSSFLGIHAYHSNYETFCLYEKICYYCLRSSWVIFYLAWHSRVCGNLLTQCVCKVPWRFHHQMEDVHIVRQIISHQDSIHQPPVLHIFYQGSFRVQRKRETRKRCPIDHPVWTCFQNRNLWFWCSCLYPRVNFLAWDHDE